MATAEEEVPYTHDPDIGPEPGEGAPPAVIDAFVDTLMERMADLMVQKKRNNDYRAARLKQINEHVDTLNARIDERYERLRLLVLVYARTMDYGKRKSRELAFGKVGHRRGRDRVEFADEDKVGRWAFDNGIEVKMRATKTDVLKHVLRTGDLPDEVELIRGADKEWFVTLAGVPNLPEGGEVAP